MTSSRRAARTRHPAAPRIATSTLPAVLELGPCVEVWGDGPVPAGLGAAVDTYFADASARFRMVRDAVDPASPDHQRSSPAAWSLDGRNRRDARLRPVIVNLDVDIPDIELNDLGGLRAEAQTLTHQAQQKRVS